MLSFFSITSFRGIDRLELSLGKRTYIQWANGSGKTHVLDAIHLLSGAHPLYGNTVMDSGCVFEWAFSEDSLTKSYRLLQDEKRGFFAVQGTKTTKPKYMNALPWRTVYISPFDMNLLYFAPSMRRDAMDLVLSRVYEQFPRIKRDYDIVMRQRNSLLKHIRDGLAQRNELDFWDAKFAELAETYGLYRTRYIQFIESSLARFPSFFSRYPLVFSYDGSVEKERISLGTPEMTDADVIRAYLIEHRERDILSWHTHIGPHRDDWGFFLQKNEETIPVQEYLSRWEMKMILLGLKMIEAEFITETMSLPVIILIDDIFAELDENNSEIFLNSLTTYQVILTSQKALPNHEKHHDFICINLEYS
jgi:DNA replication and repair protein RecF